MTSPPLPRRPLACSASRTRWSRRRAAVWTRPGAPLAPGFGPWQDGLPPAVRRGPLPGPAALDAWAREHTAGLIERFPLDIDPAVYLILASALGTRVSWEVPFGLVPAAALGEQSPWARRLGQVLRTPSPAALPPPRAGLPARRTSSSSRSPRRPAMWPCTWPGPAAACW